METTTLGEIISLQRGYDLTEGQRQPGTVPVVGSAGIHGYHNEAKAKGPGVALGRSGASFGRVTFIRQDFWPHNTTLFVTNFKGNDPIYVRYLLQSLDFSHLNSGSAQQSLNRNYVYGIPVRRVSLIHQKCIASILSVYDDLIENNTHRIAILEEMAMRLYEEWFVHLRFPGHEKVKMVESELGQLPTGWQIKKLEEIIIEHIGGGWGKDEYDINYPEPAWVIRGTDIPNARHCWVENVPYRYHSSSNLKSRQLQPGDIIFEVSGGSKGQPLGRTLLITPQLLSAFDNNTVICASFCKKVRPNVNEYGSELMYLSFLAGYHSGEIERFQVQSTGISNFKWTEYIKQTLRIVPSKEICLGFREMVAPLLSQIATIGRKSAVLRTTRDLLLPKLISGEIDVSHFPDPEIKEV